VHTHAGQTQAAALHRDVAREAHAVVLDQTDDDVVSTLEENGNLGRAGGADNVRQGLLSYADYQGGLRPVFWTAVQPCTGSSPSWVVTLPRFP